MVVSVLFSALKRLSESSNTTEDVRKMAEGAVWVLDGQNLAEAQRRKNKKLQENNHEGKSCNACMLRANLMF